MFSLLRGFYEDVTFVPERRVVLLGVGSAGKTTLLECLKLHFPTTAAAKAAATKAMTEANKSKAVAMSAKAGASTESITIALRLTNEKIASIAPTVGLNVAKLSTGPENLLVWDLGGTKALRPIWARYVADAEALIWVVDASDPQSMNESRTCLRELLDDTPLSNAPLLVYANKQDAGDVLDAVKTSLALDILSDAEFRPQCVQAASAVTGVGIREGLDWLLYRLRNPTGNIKTSIL
jgi:small GTP-binding protein